MEQEELDLTSYILRVRDIVSDSRTFLYVRSKRISEVDGIKIGGGNFTIALSMFVSLNYLSVLNGILRGRTTGKAFDTLTPKNATLFEDLVSDLNLEERIGFPASEAGKIWRAWRNKVAKGISPASGNQAITLVFSRDDKDFKKLVSATKRSGYPAFINEGGIRKCYVDLLAVLVEKVCIQLITDIADGRFPQKNIALALKLLNKFFK